MRTSRKLWTVCRFHLICCFFTIRLATISLTADSTNPVEDPLSRTVTLSIIGHRICVQLHTRDDRRRQCSSFLDRLFFDGVDVGAYRSTRGRAVPPCKRTGAEVSNEARSDGFACHLCGLHDESSPKQDACAGERLGWL